SDGRLSIPERSNGVNDLLDEVRWELQFLLAMQVPEGHELEGMAHHKLHDESWTPLPTAPHQDTRRRYLYPPSVTATLNLAANAAHCARIWRTIDEAFSERCLNAAVRAFDAAEKHADMLPTGSNFDGGGPYDDRDASDERYWAAAELFITTGEGRYEQVMRSSPHFLAAHAADGTGEIAWPSVRTLGTLSLLVHRKAIPESDFVVARDNVLASADRYIQESEREGFAIPYTAKEYDWGSNSAILNRALILAVAYDLTGKRMYRDAVTDAMDYVLGRNPLDQSYVTGYGARPVRNPHHRFWARSLDRAYPAPPPGALSGGPNSSNMSDPVARKLKGRCRPQTCWRDDIEAFTQNEVAINWNAPLFWVAAWLDETEGAR
ncbi:MAG TPA: glycoside hydrolase family 9 protein, partial [Steroidobacteraceae bacterium]